MFRFLFFPFWFRKSRRKQKRKKDWVDRMNELDALIED